MDHLPNFGLWARFLFLTLTGRHTGTVLVKSFAHLNGNFFLASLEAIGKEVVDSLYYKLYNGVLQLTDYNEDISSK